MFKYIVIPDPEYQQINENNIRFCHDEAQVKKQVQALANHVPEGGIQVYKIDSIMKMVRKPEFAKYNVNENGEILPS